MIRLDLNEGQSINIPIEDAKKRLYQFIDNIGEDSSITIIYDQGKNSLNGGTEKYTLKDTNSLVHILKNDNFILSLQKNGILYRNSANVAFPDGQLSKNYVVHEYTYSNDSLIKIVLPECIICKFFDKNE